MIPSGSILSTRLSFLVTVNANARSITIGASTEKSVSSGKILFDFGWISDSRRITDMAEKQFLKSSPFSYNVVSLARTNH
jgi:hypothetical protein